MSIIRQPTAAGWSSVERYLHRISIDLCCSDFRRCDRTSQLWITYKSSRLLAVNSLFENAGRCCERCCYDLRRKVETVLGVPKLSVLLHMVHAWVKANTALQDFESPRFRDPIPFVDPHFEGFAVVAALEEHGDLIVCCGSGDDVLRLRTLLLGLNINMLKMSAATESSNSRSLSGFELIDVVTEPGRGSKMKKITIMSEGRNSNWLKIANAVDLVIVCANLGDAIKPVFSQERKNLICNLLPPGFDMLAMHVSCISRLTKLYGEDLAATVYSTGIAIAEGRSWRRSGETFKSCNHEESSAKTCWDRTTILQAVRRTGTVSPLTTPRRIALLGVVVFGTRNAGIGFL
jgi:hypothetical protein